MKTDDQKSENEIEGEIIEFLRAIGLYVWKSQNTGIYDQKAGCYRKRSDRYIKGTSDILGIIPYYDSGTKAALGRFLAIEVKDKDGKVTPEQRTFITRINEEGGIAFVTRSLSNCIEQLKKFFPRLQNIDLEKVALPSGTHH